METKQKHEFVTFDESCSQSQYKCYVRTNTYNDAGLHDNTPFTYLHSVLYY